MAGLLTRIETAAPRHPRASITTAQELADELTRMMLVGSSDSAIPVTPERAAREPTVFVCLRVLGESLGQLPLIVQRKADNGEREIVKDHRVARLLGKNGQPNTFQTPFEFRETATRHVALRGNGYAVKVRVGGELRELLPVHPSRVTVEQDERWQLRYKVRIPNGGTETLGPDDLFQIRGPSDDGIRGVDIVTHLADTIGLSLAQIKDQNRLFSTAARLGLVLQTDASLGDEAYRRLKESVDEQHAGIDNARKTMILEEGLKAEKVSMTAEEAQSLESRKFQRSLLASLWRIPPHMVGDLDKATFSNIENLARQFVDYALAPWLNRWEGTLSLHFLTPSEREDGLQIKLDPRVLLRGDHKTRAEFYNKGISGRWLNPNEVRELEDRAPYDGGEEFRNPAIEPAGTPDGNDDDAAAEDRSNSDGTQNDKD